MRLDISLFSFSQINPFLGKLSGGEGRIVGAPMSLLAQGGVGLEVNKRLEGIRHLRGDISFFLSFLSRPFALFAVKQKGSFICRYARLCFPWLKSLLLLHGKIE